MSTMNDVSGICISDSALVLCPTGRARKVGSVGPGDIILAAGKCDDGKPFLAFRSLLAVIKGEVKTPLIRFVISPAGQCLTVSPDRSARGIDATLGHPVCSLKGFLSHEQEAWIAGGSIHGGESSADDEDMQNNRVTSVIFDDPLVLGLVGIDSSFDLSKSVLCTSLGHGMTSHHKNGVAAHHYLGDRATLLQDMKRIPGWPTIKDNFRTERNDLSHICALRAC